MYDACNDLKVFRSCFTKKGFRGYLVILKQWQFQTAIVLFEKEIFDDFRPCSVSISCLEDFHRMKFQSVICHLLVTNEAK